MRLEVETGTDVAAVAIGDPSRLDALRASRSSKTTKAALDEATASGSLWRAVTGADGAYLFHIFVDEDPPRDVAGMLSDPQTVDRFHVPSGRLLVAGEECFGGAFDLQRHPHMGREIQVPAGDYALTAYHADPPDDEVERRFASVASAAEREAWRIGSSAPGWCIVATVVAIVAAYFAYVRTASGALASLALAIPLAAWAWCYWFTRRPSFVDAERRFRAIEREIPSIVVVLRSA